MKLKTVLGIYSNPDTNGNSRYIVERVLDQCKAKGLEIDTVDLEKTKVPYYSPTQKQDKNVASIAKKIHAADLLVFDVPSYWKNMPAQLKALFDNLLPDIIDLSGDKAKPKLKGKRSIIVTTTAVSSFFDFFSRDSLLTYRNVARILKQGGIKRIEHLTFGNNDKRKAKEDKELFQEVEILIKDIL